MSGFAQRSFTLAYGGGRFDASAELFPAGSNPLQERLQKQDLSPEQIAALHQIVAQAQLMAQNLSPDSLAAIGGLMRSINVMKAGLHSLSLGRQSSGDVRSAAAAVQQQLESAQKALAGQPNAQGNLASMLATLKAAAVAPEKTRNGHVVRLAVVREARAAPPARDARMTVKGDAARPNGAQIAPLRTVRDTAPVSKGEAGAKGETLKGVVAGTRVEAASKATAVVLDFGKAKATAAALGAARQPPAQSGTVVALNGAKGIAAPLPVTRGGDNAPKTLPLVNPSTRGGVETIAVKGNITDATARRDATPVLAKGTGDVAVKAEIRGGQQTAETRGQVSPAAMLISRAETTPAGQAALAATAKAEIRPGQPAAETRAQFSVGTASAGRIETSPAQQTASVETRQTASDTSRRAEITQTPVVAASVVAASEARTVVADAVHIHQGRQTVDAVVTQAQAQARVEIPVARETALGTERVSPVQSVVVPAVTDAGAPAAVIQQQASRGDGFQNSGVPQVFGLPPAVDAGFKTTTFQMQTLSGGAVESVTPAAVSAAIISFSTPIISTASAANTGAADVNTLTGPPLAVEANKTVVGTVLETTRAAVSEVAKMVEQVTQFAPAEPVKTLVNVVGKTAGDLIRQFRKAAVGTCPPGCTGQLGCCRPVAADTKSISNRFASLKKG